MIVSASILVVEDDVVMRTTLARHLSRDHHVVTAGTVAEARELFAEHRISLVILDLNLPDGEGVSLVPLFHGDDEAEVVVITAYPKVQSAVQALKAGAFDYLNKPFELDEFDIVVAKALKHRHLRDEVMRFRREKPRAGGVDRLLGDSPAVARLREEIMQVAGTPSTTVLVRGESGTGKELVVEAIHHESARRRAPLVRVNCSSIPETMIEAELFGHEKGAFTGATKARRGLVEMAHGGTLFLDEIGDLPMSLQPKLLRTLESRTIRRVGGSHETPVDVRFVAATNRDLEAMVAEGGFREDLFFRLQVFDIRIPPLQERPGDVAILAHHFLGRFAAEMGGEVDGFTPEAMARLESYVWPGNVRELRNMLERAVILSRSRVLTCSELPLGPAKPRATVCADFCPAFPEGASQFPSLAEVEGRYVRCVYRGCDENKTRAADVLGISRVTLRQKLKRD